MSIAYSCARGRLHVNADWVVLEPVDRDLRPTPPGEASHTVLLTNLANRVQPVIRYDLGDSVTLVTCTCDSPLPAIRAEGRRDDVLALRASDGTTIKLSPLALTTVMEEAVADLRFQLVQVAPSAIDVRLAPCAEAERVAAWHAAEHALRGYLARQSLANAQLHLADESPLPDPRSGKLREVLASEMNSGWRH
jgi:phenylacetate-coenzyme A ligase PaaK-like adenylate-forming protein